MKCFACRKRIWFFQLKTKVSLRGYFENKFTHNDCSDNIEVMQIHSKGIERLTNNKKKEVDLITKAQH